MEKLNRKGFTLVELIATIVVLAIVMGIGSYAITGLIQRSKEKDYELLIEEVNNAVEGYYLECKYVNNNCVSEITLGYLVNNGFLTGNSTDNDMGLVNPMDNVDISGCKIKYTYSNGKINVVAVNPKGSCPSSY